MGVVKNIAVDSLTYGVVTICSRMFSYAMVYFHVRWLSVGEYGTFSQFYSLIAVLNVLYILGMETSFFRFIHCAKDDHSKIGNMQVLILAWSLLLSVCMCVNADFISQKMVGSTQYASYVYFLAAIVFLDTIASIPYVRLRYERKKKTYITFKVCSIFLTMGLQFFLMYHSATRAYLGMSNLAYLFIANLVASLLILGCLLRYTSWSFRMDGAFLKQLLVYSIPLTVAGLGGVVNDMADRMMIPFLASPNRAFAEEANGIYAANYKVSILLILVTQAYRMGAEPFLFRLFKEDLQPQKVYAKLMELFVIIGCMVTLAVVLFLHLWKHLIVSRVHPEYEQGLWVVPILTFANLLLGMYFNFSIWFKVKNKTSYGMWITLGVAGATVLLNWGLIPLYGYWAAAWVTLFSYLSMALAAYGWGRKHYPIPYPMKNIIFCLGASLGCTLLYKYGLYEYGKDNPYGLTIASVLLWVGFVGLLKWKYRWNIRAWIQRVRLSI